MRLLDEGTEDQIARAKAYVPRYIETSVRGLYEPSVYRDADTNDPYEFRERLLADPARQRATDRVTASTIAFYKRIGVMG